MFCFHFLFYYLFFIILRMSSVIQSLFFSLASFSVALFHLPMSQMNLKRNRPLRWYLCNQCDFIFLFKGFPLVISDLGFLESWCCLVFGCLCGTIKWPINNLWVMIDIYFIWNMKMDRFKTMTCFFFQTESGLTQWVSQIRIVSFLFHTCFIYICV